MRNFNTLGDNKTSYNDIQSGLNFPKRYIEVNYRPFNFSYFCRFAAFLFLLLLTRSRFVASLFSSVEQREEKPRFPVKNCREDTHARTHTYTYTQARAKRQRYRRRKRTISLTVPAGPSFRSVRFYPGIAWQFLGKLVILSLPIHIVLSIAASVLGFR